MDTDAVFREATAPLTKLYGVYRGRVEYINDPLQLGRVRVRIPVFHATADQIKTENLPWAYVVSAFGGGYDYGAKYIPPVGSTVYVMFEGGDMEFPLVIGTWEGNPGEFNIMLRDPKGKWPKGPISMSPDEQHPWYAPPGADAPKEFLLQAGHRPERYVPFKSVKGATIDIEDRDEVEHTHIVDRAGQGLFLESPVKAKAGDSGTFPANENNEAQRGLRTAQEGDQIPLESTLATEASVVLVDIGSQSITLHSSEAANNIRIASKQPDTDESNMTLGRNKELPGDSSATLELGSGHKVINLEITNNGVTVAKISLDGNIGMLSIDAPNATKVNSESFIIDGDVQISGNLVISKTLTCLDDGLFAGELVSSHNNGKKDIDNMTPPQPNA
jgi:hypothetical protein